MKERHVKYIVSNSGRKFPYYHPLYNLHPKGVKRYCNLGHNRKSPIARNVPDDGYPYTYEYVYY